MTFSRPLSRLALRPGPDREPESQWQTTTAKGLSSAASLRISRNILVIDGDLRFSFTLSRIRDMSKASFTCYWYSSMLDSVPYWHFNMAMISEKNFETLTTSASKRVVAQMRKLPIVVIEDEDQSFTPSNDWDVIGRVSRNLSDLRLAESLDNLITLYLATSTN